MPGVFEQYELNDFELKELIVETGIEYAYFANQYFLLNKLSELSLNLNNKKFVRELLVVFPELRHFDIEDERLSLSDQLKLLAINLSFLVNTRNLEQIMRDTWRLVFVTNLFGVRYGIGMNLVELIHNEKSNKTTAKKVRKLSKFITHGVNSELYQIIKSSEKELERLSENETVESDFNMTMGENLKEVESYIDSNMGNRVLGMLEKLYLEAIDNFVPSLFKRLGVPKDLNKKVSAEIKKGVKEHLDKTFKEQFRDLRGGGGRYNNKDTWDNKKKIALYLEVESLSTEEGISIWQFTYNKFKEDDYCYKTKEDLLKTTSLSKAPYELVQNAFKAWNKYRDRKLLKTNEDHPFAFALKHAAILLEFPTGRYSSMKRYYEDGARLYKNTLDNENPK